MKPKSTHRLSLYSFFIFCFFGIYSSVFSQQNIKSPSVIAAAGEISRSRDMMVEWTLGEIFVESILDHTINLTQGYHQPMLLVKELSKPNASAYEIRVFPNPVQDLLRVIIQSSIQDALILKINDITGRTVLIQDAPGGSNEIQLKTRNLPEGMYILSVVNRKGYRIDSFKLIKQS
ncbi:MAG: T9SS type A sorting domain-containing protein [Saprospiraceae bacterium]